MCYGGEDVMRGIFLEGGPRWRVMASWLKEEMKGKLLGGRAIL